MNRFFLYFPCLLALVFSSCEDDDGIGLAIQPDEDFMSTELNVGRLADYVTRIGSRTLEKRVSCLKKVYSI